MEIHNSEAEVELRKRRTNLNAIGSGIILFGIWTIAKTAYMMFIQGEIQQILPTAEEIAASTHSANYLIIESYVSMILVMLFELWMRLIVGRRAKALGHGKKNAKKYRFPAMLLIIGSIFTIAVEVIIIFGIGIASDVDRSQTSISAIIIEVTSLILMIELMYNTSRVRKLTREEAA